jgi:hypothetical protein
MGALGDTGIYDPSGRRQGWTYDTAGQVLRDDTGDHLYDARGSQALFKNWKYFVGGGQTGHPQTPGAEIEQSYDGQGQVAKRVETKRTETPHDPNDPTNPLTDIAASVTTTYYVRSSVLGAGVLELDGNGHKSKGHVYAGGGELARQEIFNLNPLVSGVSWQHGTPGTGSWVETHEDKSAEQMEMDPMGADVGKSDPFLTDPTPSYLEMRGDRYLYIDGGDPFDYSSGREIDGMPVSESEFQRRINNGSVQGVLPPGSKADWVHSGGSVIYEKPAYGEGVLNMPAVESGGEGTTFYDPVDVDGRFGGGGGMFFQRKPRPTPTPAPTWKPWVVRNVSQLEKKVDSGNWEGERDYTGNRGCATLPMTWDYKYQGRPIGPLNNPRKNWHMGAALKYGAPLERGTVVANFDRNKKMYLNEPHGNHTAIFLEWYEDKGWLSTEKGMEVIEQGPNWKPRRRKIPFEPGAVYYSDAGNFNVCEINEPPPGSKKKE